MEMLEAALALLCAVGAGSLLWLLYWLSLLLLLLLCRGLSLLLLLSHLEQIACIQSTCLSRHSHAHEPHHCSVFITGCGTHSICLC